MVPVAKIEAPRPKRPLTQRQLAQRRAAGAKARVALRAKNDRPASGWPASGLPASDIDAMGPGWGGEAKGPGAGPEALPAARAAPRRSREEREWWKDRCIDLFVAVALDPGTPVGLRLIAASKALDLIRRPPKRRLQIIPVCGDHRGCDDGKDYAGRRNRRSGRSGGLPPAV